MFSTVGWVLAGLALYIMYAARNGRNRLLDSQGKLAGLLVVIALVGVLLLFGNYNKIQVSVNMINLGKEVLFYYFPARILLLLL